MALRKRKGSFGLALLWMILLSIALFWLPVFGPFAAGFVGGMKAGGVRHAFLASLFPALAAAALLFLMSLLLGVPILGTFAGTAVGLVLVGNSLPLVVGALLGASFAPEEYY